MPGDEVGTTRDARAGARRALGIAERTCLVLAIVLPVATVGALLAALVPVAVAEACLPVLGVGAVAVPAGAVVAGFVAPAGRHPRLAGTAVVLAGLGLLATVALAVFVTPAGGLVAVQPLATLAAAWPRLEGRGGQEVGAGRTRAALVCCALPVVAVALLGLGVGVSAVVPG